MLNSKACFLFACLLGSCTTVQSSEEPATPQRGPFHADGKSDRHAHHRDHSQYCEYRWALAQRQEARGNNNQYCRDIEQAIGAKVEPEIVLLQRFAVCLLGFAEQFVIVILEDNRIALGEQGVVQFLFTGCQVRSVERWCLTGQ